MTVRNILLLTNALDLGGAETHVITLASELSQRGYGVTVGSNGGRLVAQLAAAGIEHIVMPLETRSPEGILRGIGRVRRLIGERKIDLIHAHARIPAFVADRACRGTATKYITTYHGAYSAGWFWRAVSRWGERAIAVSEDVRTHLIERLGAPADRICVIPNGIDTRRFAPNPPLAAEGWVDDSAPCIAHLSRLDDEFAEPALAAVRGMPEIVRAYPGARLVIGGDGNRQAEVLAAAQSANASLGAECCQFLGWVLDTENVFNRADVVVAVARTAMEAMACGRPIVLAGEGGYAGVLTGDRIEALSKANFTARGSGQAITPELISAGVIGLLRNGDLRAALGRSGREFIAGQCSVPFMVDQIEAVYRAVLR